MAEKMIKCHACNKEIASSAKTCPSCGAKLKKPIFKKWWFWVLVVIGLIILIGNSGSSNDTTEENKPRDEYTVSFNPLNGHESVDVVVKTESLVEKPVDPIKETEENSTIGTHTYKFSHWAQHEHSIDGSERFDFNTPITKSYTLFAHYEDTYTPPESKLTRESYDKIQNGMTKDQVVAILGNPDSTSESEMQGIGKTELYYYTITRTTSCQIYFSNGKVNMKNWTEL